MMWRALDSVMRKLNTFWNEVEEFGQTMRGVLFDRLRRQDKLQTTTDESCERSEDSGFADDEGLHCLSSDYIPNSRPTESDVQSGDSSLRKPSKLRSAKKCRPKSDLGRHVSAFFKIYFHVLDH